jgi:hypothetical protein
MAWCTLRRLQLCQEPVGSSPQKEKIHPADESSDSPSQQNSDLMHTDETAVQFGKPKTAFRVYGTGSAPREALVTRHYTLMRSNQTVDFVNKMEEKVGSIVVMPPPVVDVVHFATCELHLRCNHASVTSVCVCALQYLKFDHAEMTIWEAFEHLGKFVDASDPDTEVNNGQVAVVARGLDGNAFPGCVLCVWVAVGCAATAPELGSHVANCRSHALGGTPGLVPVGWLVARHG